MNKNVDYKIDVQEDLPNLLGVTEDEAVEIAGRMLSDYIAWGGQEECGDGITAALGKGKFLSLYHDEDDHTLFKLEITD